MTADSALFEESAEDLFENAPCGYLSTRPDGTIVRVNRTFEDWTGLRREELLAGRRFQDLLTPGGRIYHETHYAPLLQMQGWVREIAVEIVRADGTRLPALVNSVLHNDNSGRPYVVRTTVFDATDRRRYEQELLRARQGEHEIALELQRSLLSGELPRGDGLEIEVAYRPAVATLEVGGDWYDAFWTTERRSIGLVVGDVVGRGIRAAATMGQLRSAVRALAGTGLSPGALLSAVDHYSHRHGVGEMATLAYAQVDLETREVRYACAGHPPPALLEPGREPRFAWDGRSVPLAAHIDPRPRSEGRLTVPEGTLLLLFTDGLFEKAGQPLDASLAGLLAEAGRHREQALPAMTEALVRTMVGDRPGQDDVCLLVARI